MSLPPTTCHCAGTILEQAEAHTRRGEYSEAMDVLARADAGVNAEHPEYWLGMVCVASARNKLHMQDDQGALDLLGVISTSLRSANPKIDSECQTVMGILRRRAAHRLWKSGHAADAQQKAQGAIEAFDMAEKSAQIALDERLRHNAVLNRLYARGLLYAMLGTSQEHNVELLIDAVLAEARSRESTPPNIKDDLSGLIIVADLALGAQIGLDRISSLSDKADYASACKLINVNRCTSWPELILAHVRGSTCSKPNIVARALLLGEKMLNACNQGTDSLLIEYAVQLRICYLDLKDLPLHGMKALLIKESLSRFPPHILDRIMAPTFLR